MEDPLAAADHFESKHSQNDNRVDKSQDWKTNIFMEFRYSAKSRSVFNNVQQKDSIVGMVLDKR
jgi:hypothetical protein